MKLTPKQKDTVKKMQEGYKFSTSWSRPLLFKNGKNIYVSWGVVNKLEELGLLKTDTVNSLFCHFHLTELGKTIEL